MPSNCSSHSGSQDTKGMLNPKLPTQNRRSGSSHLKGEGAVEELLVDQQGETHIAQDDTVVDGLQQGRH